MSSTRQFNLRMPEAVCTELDAIARRKNTSPTDLARRFIALGVAAIKLEDQGGDSGLVMRRDGKELLVTFF